MSFVYQIELRPNYVDVSCQGIYDVDSTLEVASELFNVAMSEGLRSVLVDVRELKGDIRTIERMDWGKRFAEIQLSSAPGIRVAVVGIAPLVDTKKFGETVAVNRGASLAVFEHREQAIEWLESEASQ